MFHHLFNKVKGKNNQIFIIKNNKKIKLRHKLKGLNIDIAGNNNYIEIEFPIKFKNTTIKMRGHNIKFELKKSNTRMQDTFFDLGDFAQVFIDEDSRFNMPNSYICINNNRKNQPHKLVIGTGAQIGQDFYLRTSDGHCLFNLGEEFPYNEPQDIVIGNNVWIGAKCSVMKGAQIPSNTVIGSCSLVTKKFFEENTIIAGHPAKVIKRNIQWERAPYGDYIDKILNPTLPSEKNVLIKKLKRKLRFHKLFKIWSNIDSFRH